MANPFLSDINKLVKTWNVDGKGKMFSFEKTIQVMMTVIIIATDSSSSFHRFIYCCSVYLKESIEGKKNCSVISMVISMEISLYK